jgi:SOS response regulatory protein OraA/RecX
MSETIITKASKRRSKNGIKNKYFSREIEIDFSQLKKLVEDSLVAAKSLTNKISEVRKRRQIKDFLTYRGFLVLNRKLATVLAGFYYNGKGLKS